MTDRAVIEGLQARVEECYAAMMEQQRLMDTLLQQQAEQCVWTEEVGGEFWLSACGVAYTFTHAGPVANGLRFCCGCGHPLTEKD